MSNNIHLICQTIISGGWLLLASYIIRRYPYVNKVVWWVTFGISFAIAINLIWEMYVSNYVLTWNIPFWYPLNICVQMVLYYLFHTIEKLTDSLSRAFAKIAILEKRIQKIKQDETTSNFNT